MIQWQTENIQIMKKVQYLLLLILLSACSANNNSAPDSEQMCMSTLWYQNAAEMRAIYYQSFNLAELRVKEALENYDHQKPPAVIVDIDETMLDNSPSEAKNILEGERYSKERWSNWTSLASAKPLPGSLEFALFLKEAGVELFYISNRSVDDLDVTIENLVKFSFPYADTDHVFLKSDTSDKTKRRQTVSTDYNILLLVGDNLGDFSSLFDDRSDKNGKSLVDQYQAEFGQQFIVLPNPMYGSWTSALYGSTSDLSPKEIAELRKTYLYE